MPFSLVLSAAKRPRSADVMDGVGGRALAVPDRFGPNLGCRLSWAHCTLSHTLPHTPTPWLDLFALRIRPTAAAPTNCSDSLTAIFFFFPLLSPNVFGWAWCPCQRQPSNLQLLLLRFYPPSSGRIFPHCASGNQIWNLKLGTNFISHPDPLRAAVHVRIAALLQCTKHTPLSPGKRQTGD